METRIPLTVKPVGFNGSPLREIQMAESHLNIAEIAKDRKLDPDAVIEILLPYQKKWLSDRAGVKMHTKSRRIGLSWGDACGKVLSSASSRGSNTFYLAYEKEMTRQYIIDCSNWAKALNFAVSEIYEDEVVYRDGKEDKATQVYRIFFNSGNRIEALASNPRNLRSKQGNIILDECAFMDDFKAVLKAARAMRVWGSSIDMVTTYNGIDEPYYQLEQEVLKGRLKYSRHFTTFDMAIEQGLYKQICLVQRKEWSLKGQIEWYEQTIAEFGEDADEELFCIPNQSSGAYFPRILVERAMDETIPVLNLSLKDEFALATQDEKTSHITDWIEERKILSLLYQLNPNYKTSFGFDFGRSGDLSYLIVFQELPNLVRKAAFAVEMRNVPFTQQEQILFTICDRLPRLIGAAMDGRGNGEMLAERTGDRYGHHRIEKVMLSQPWYNEHMPKYKAALEDKKVLLPASSDLIGDHRGIEMIRGVPKPVEGKIKGTSGEQRHSDGAIAIALAWYASCFDNELAQPALGSFVFNNWELGTPANIN